MPEFQNRSNRRKREVQDYEEASTLVNHECGRQLVVPSTDWNRDLGSRALARTLPDTIGMVWVLYYVRLTYNDDSDVIMTATGSASQMRGSEFFPRQVADSWVQTNGSVQEFSMPKDY